MRYIRGMTNNAIASTATVTRETIASNLDAELTRQRWSKRKAAAALGLSPVYVSRRTSGEVELSGSDLVMFAAFLQIPVTRFFVGLPDMDSNHEPTHFESAAQNVTYLSDRPRRADQTASDHAAVVTFVDFPKVENV